MEALAYDLNAVSTGNGAIGVDPELCNGKLIVCSDNNWNSFADAVFRAIDIKRDTPAAFYQHFYWANITRRAAEFIVD